MPQLPSDRDERMRDAFQKEQIEQIPVGEHSFRYRLTDEGKRYYAEELNPLWISI